MTKKFLAEDGFDPSTSGLWAQHAPTAPLCLLVKCVVLTQYDYGFVFTTVPPVIKLQPAKNIEVIEGHPLALEVKAECRPGQPVYQWFKERVPIAGQDKGTLLIKNAAVANSGNFHTHVIKLMWFIQDKSGPCTYRKLRLSSYQSFH